MYAPFIEGLFIYPVKGLHGISVNHALATRRGLAVEGVKDREFMLVDERGIAVTQRDLPAMARFATSVRNGALTIGTPGHGSITVAPGDAGSTIIVKVWDDTVTAHVTSPAHDKWFSDALGRSVRLVRQMTSDQRLCAPDRSARPGQDEVGFADSHPYLVVNQATLSALNARLHTPLPMSRFRGNIIVAGMPAEQEYGTETLAIGAINFAFTDPCARCKVTTIDQDSGEIRPNEHFARLKETHFYRSRRPDGKVDQGVVFGVNAIPDKIGGIAVGQMVRPTLKASPWQFGLRASPPPGG